MNIDTSTTLGYPEDQEAYRSEIFGIIHGVMIIERIGKNTTSAIDAKLQESPIQ